MEWPNGRRYEGSWKKGLYDGYGTLTTQLGFAKSGMWEAGRCVQLMLPEMQ